MGVMVLSPETDPNLIFFRIKSLEDVFEIASSDSYLDLKKKINAINHSFRVLKIDNSKIPNSGVPKHIFEKLNKEERLLLKDIEEYTKDLLDEEDFQHVSFFLNNFNFNVFSNTNKKINTTLGEQEISLLFAENFRFKSEKGSFNFFSLPKENRNIIIPNDKDSFIFAIDFRQFEFRTNLLLLGYNDLLKENNLYENIGKEFNLPENDVKTRVISNLYSPEIKDEKVKSFLKRNTILDRVDKDMFWYKTFPVYVKYEDHDGKKIHSITQSISQYFYINKMNEIFNLLKGYEKSSFLFPLHDSMVFSIHQDESDLMEKIISTLTNSIYKIKCYIGTDFKELKEVS